MALEPYDPCPCGNGKKFKFCCQPIYEELLAVDRLIQEGQPKQALVAAEKLEPQHSNNPLLLRSKTMAFLLLSRYEEARELARRSQTVNPQDPYGYYFEIRLRLLFDTWEQVRPIVERHLSFIAEKNPRLAYRLVLEIAQTLMDNGCYLAARRYLFDAATFARSKEEFQHVTSILADQNQTSEVPLPLRSAYHLRSLPENQPNQAEFAEAIQVAVSYNWTKAAQLFEALSEKDPHQPVLTFNAGLCFAWSGDLAAAAELFGRSADDLPDFEAAVQLETLAQLHEQRLPEEQIPSKAYHYRVKSVSRLLSQFDQEPRLVRQPQPSAESTGLDRQIAASYILTNHPRTEGNLADPQSISVALGSVVVFDEQREAEMPAEIYFRALSPQFTDAERDLILRACGEQLDLTEGEDWGELIGDEEGIPRDVAGLNFRFIPPPDVRRSDVQRLLKSHGEYVVNEQWTQLPLSALDGMTPAEAAKDPDLHLPVCAAINVMASFADAMGFTVDVDDLRRRLNLPAIQPLVIQTVDELKQMSLQDCLRISFMEVPVEVLSQAFAIVANSRSLYPMRRLLEAIYDREVTIPEFDVASICRMASSLAMRALDLDDAQLWNDRGREAGRKAGDDLMARLEWDMDLLEFVVLEGNEPQVMDLLRKFAREYFHKIPECKPLIQRLVEVEKIDNPQVLAILNGTDLLTVGAGASSGGLWTPESAGAAAPAGKLWLPGQE